MSDILRSDSLYKQKNSKNIYYQFNHHMSANTKKENITTNDSVPKERTYVYDTVRYILLYYSLDHVTSLFCRLVTLP